MPDVLLLLPDLALIVCGYLICRYTPLDRSVWDGTERLVY
jgi:malonate transporter